MRKQGEGRTGRPCCGECYSPWKCSEPIGRKLRCGCHIRPEPHDSRIQDVAAWLKQDVEIKYAQTKAAWLAGLPERRAA